MFSVKATGLQKKSLAFNTNTRKARVNESVIMAITGHSTRAMFARYNTIDSEDKQQAVDHMQAFVANVDQTVDQEGVREC